jgi:hypothetical protein
LLGDVEPENGTKIWLIFYLAYKIETLKTPVPAVPVT